MKHVPTCALATQKHATGKSGGCHTHTHTRKRGLLEYQTGGHHGYFQGQVLNLWNHRNGRVKDAIACDCQYLQRPWMKSLQRLFFSLYDYIFQHIGTQNPMIVPMKITSASGFSTSNWACKAAVTIGRWAVRELADTACFRDVWKGREHDVSVQKPPVDDV